MLDSSLFISEGFQHPDELSELEFIQHHFGGTGGVYEFRVGQTEYMLKLSTSDAHLKMEVLADAIYHVLGVKVPAFAVLNKLSDKLKTLFERHNINLPIERQCYRISMKIKGDHPAVSELASSNIDQHFVIDAFLRNTDLHLNNLILSEDGIYRIDNGSVLAMRALGGENLDNIEHVTELLTLHSQVYSKYGPRLYSSLSSESILHQIKNLIAKQSLVLNTAMAVHNALNLESFSEVYEHLVARFHSLHRDTLSEDLLAGKSFDAIKQQVNLTPQAGDAAGILSISFIHGQAFVLLACCPGQKDDEDTWCNLGGVSKTGDETYATTAAREVYEASNGLLDYAMEEIRFHPFYSFNVENESAGHHYRVYLSPIPYVSTQKITNYRASAIDLHQEYTRFAWVKLDSLITESGVRENFAVDIVNEQKSKKKKRLITFKERIKLHPNIVLLLQKEGIKNTFEKLKRKPPYMPLRTKRLQTRLSETMSHRAELICEIKTKAQKPDSSQKVKQEKCLSLSDIHLGQILPATCSDETLAEKVNRFFESGEALKADGGYDDDCRRQLVRAWETEQSYFTKGYFTLYHAAPREIVVLYDLFTELYRKLRLIAKDSYTKFRLSELGFKSMPTLMEFMAYFSNHGQKNIDNYDQDYAEIGLSTNLFLFGSHKVSTSASYYLYSENRSSRGAVNAFSESGILDQGLAEMGLHKPFRSYLLYQLKSLYRETKSHGATLYQIHLPKSLVDDYVYFAASGGSEFVIRGEKVKLSELIKIITNNDPTEAIDLQNIQARFFMHPKVMMQAKIVPYIHHQPSERQNLIYTQGINYAAIILFKQLMRRGSHSQVFADLTASSFIYRQQLAILNGTKYQGNPITLLKDIFATGELYKLRHISWDAFLNLSTHQDMQQLLEFVTKDEYLCFRQSLNDTQLDQIWTVLEGRLVYLIHDTNQLLALLSLPTLKNQHRIQVLNAIEGQLVDWIQTESQLKELLTIQVMIKSQQHQFFYIPDLKGMPALNDEQRTQVLNALEGSLVNLLYNAGPLIELLSIPTLKDEHRTHILSVLEGKLIDLIKTESQLRALLSIPMLKDEHRTHILSVIEEQLVNLIQNGSQLAALLNIQVSKNYLEFYEIPILGEFMQALKDEHRDQILNALEGQFIDVIQNAKQLVEVLNVDTLSLTQQTQVWSFMEESLESLIQTEQDRDALLNVSTLSEAQKHQITDIAERLQANLAQDEQIPRGLPVPVIDLWDEDLVDSITIADQTSSNELQHVELPAAPCYF